MPLTATRTALLALCAAIAALALACRDGSSPPTPTPVPPTATAIPSPTPSPTPDPVGEPEPDGQRAYGHVVRLASEIGPRIAGTEGERRARDYVQSTLQSFGYDVTVQEFAFDASDFLPARVDAAGAAYEAFALRGSASGTARGPIVVAGIGRPEQFPPGTAGAVALVERGELTFAEKAVNAAAAGAAAVIIYNNEEGGAFLGAADAVAIPVVAMRRSHGLTLAAAGGPSEATVSVSPPRGTAYNVIARPKGAGACETVTGGHYDSVPVAPGADDNASGTATVIETARVAAALRLPGANCFVLFSAEEFGLFGSREYLNGLSAADLGVLRAMINLDVVGVTEPLSVLGSPDLVEIVRIEGRSSGIETLAGSLPDGVGSDHLSFRDRGVRVLMFTRADGLIHTAQDAVDRISPASLEQVVRLAVATLRELSGG